MEGGSVKVADGSLKSGIIYCIVLNYSFFTNYQYIPENLEVFRYEIIKKLGKSIKNLICDGIFLGSLKICNAYIMN